MVRRLSRAAVLFLAALPFSPAWAVDGVAVEAGRGEGVDRLGLAAKWDWNRRWFQGSDWHLGGYWELSIARWHKDNVAPRQHDEITDVGLTPVFRIQPNGLKGPYAEAAIGVHWLSHASIGGKRLSTQFQFGDLVGFGYRFGAKAAFDLGYRFQHYSNAGIKRPNPGINFHQVRLTYHF